MDLRSQSHFFLTNLRTFYDMVINFDLVNNGNRFILISVRSSINTAALMIYFIFRRLEEILSIFFINRSV